MSGTRKRFDWRKIHDDLDRRLSLLGSTFENDAARVQRLLSERSTRLAMVPASRAGVTQLSRLLVFVAGGERYALALEFAHEIVPISRLARLPGASMPVLGIIDWRGEFVTVLDIARLLGLVSADDDIPRYAIVLRSSEPRVALTTGVLDGIVRLDLSDLQAPDRLSATRRDLFKGITREAVLVLDENRLLDVVNEELRAA